MKKLIAIFFLSVCSVLSAQAGTNRYVFIAVKETTINADKLKIGEQVMKLIGDSVMIKWQDMASSRYYCEDATNVIVRVACVDNERRHFGISLEQVTAWKAANLSDPDCVAVFLGNGPQRLTQPIAGLTAVGLRRVPQE